MTKIKFVLALTVLFGGLLAAENASAQKKYGWTGVWSISTRFSPATLTIKPLSATRFKFSIEASDGANVGDISGVAKIKGNQAFFNDRESNQKKEDQTGCRLTFTNRGNLIAVEQTSECQQFAGNGVYFQGDYRKGQLKIEADNLFKMKILPAAEVDRKFKLLVGKDYESFVDSFHLRNDDEKDTQLNANIVSGCVRGICPFNAAIIVFDEKGNLWASVIYIDKNDKVFALYYSNATDWTDKLPKSIETWIADKRETSKDLEVVYKNKK